MRRELPAEFVYEDDDLFVIKDIQPIAPLHLLLVAKRDLESLRSAKEEDATLLAKMLLVAKRIAEEQGVAESGYRIVLNSGEGGGQTVFQLHMHLLAGDLKDGQGLPS
ncbi:UNVERIFIED_CONTAM: hypothetical protein GTU68_025931 [Idotea baltica]|nr:hypothetical protein [Idotea baltica]